MKIIGFIVLSIFCSANCLAQTSRWLDTDSTEFTKLYPLIPNLKLEDKYGNSDSLKEYMNFREDTLTTGKWGGPIFTLLSTDDFEIEITQTSPYIKGTYQYTYKEIESEDTMRGILVGRKAGKNTLLVFQFARLNPNVKNSFYYLEGRCFSFDHRAFIPQGNPQKSYHEFIGKIDNPNKRSFLSKGVFTFYKRD